ncbi:lactate dehydrogenase [Luteibacter yeojuensis]|uniref:Lactate dehydrogenase n=1 Tax=Luteibacter yeojuensis TaxID=345309 RepID=A0A7X5QSG9_9GAMM|nr:lactate dehydrogenase [Luteibacter yeojuensis]NID14559.1 lactate dehydrogenase [Luteibacter yeojuensis]
MIGSVTTVAGGPAPAAAGAPAKAEAVTLSAQAAPPSVVVTLSGLDQVASPATYDLLPSIAPATSPVDDGVQTTARLTIKTASGKSVVLGTQGEIQGGDALDEAERSAVEKLAGALHEALDGLAAVPPTMDLDGLLAFDPKVLASVDFSAQASNGNEPPTTLAFHADAVSRSVRMNGTGGTIDIAIDTSSPAILGSAAQRAAALDHLMRQFDQAASRGHGDRALVAMFKDAFGQLAAIRDTPPGTVPMRSALSPSEQAVLTGMPDFHASLVQAAGSPNPLRPGEKDGFSYEVSQETQVRGTDPLNRGVAQHLRAQLKASFHSSPTAGASLMLTLDPKSQNYLYTRIDDMADSQADISYRKGRLVQASIVTSASQSTEQSRYVMGKLVEQTVVPYEESATHDVLGLLKSIEDDGSAPTRRRQAEREQVLERVHADVGLESDPSRLA